MSCQGCSDKVKEILRGLSTSFPVEITDERFARVETCASCNEHNKDGYCDVAYRYIPRLISSGVCPLNKWP